MTSKGLDHLLLRGSAHRAASSEDPLCVLGCTSGDEVERKLSKLSHYAVLGVGRLASATDIRSAWVARCKIYTERRAAGYSKDELKAALRNAAHTRINEAHHVLRDPELKSAYDGTVESEDTVNDTDTATVEVDGLLGGAVRASESLRQSFEQDVESLRKAPPRFIADNRIEAVKTLVEIYGALPWLKDYIGTSPAVRLASLSDDLPALSGSQWSHHLTDALSSFVLYEFDEVVPPFSSGSEDIRETDETGQALARDLAGVLDPAKVMDFAASTFRRGLSVPEANLVLDALTEPHVFIRMPHASCGGISLPDALKRFHDDVASPARAYLARPALLLRAMAHAACGMPMDCAADLHFLVLASSGVGREAEFDRSNRVVATIIHETHLLSRCLISNIQQALGSITFDTVGYHGSQVDAGLVGEESKESAEERGDGEAAAHEQEGDSELGSRSSFAERFRMSPSQRQVRICEHRILRQARTNAFEAAMSFVDLATFADSLETICACLLAAARLLLRAQRQASVLDIPVKLSFRNLIASLVTSATSLSHRIATPFVQTYVAANAQILLCESVAELREGMVSRSLEGPTRICAPGTKPSKAVECLWGPAHLAALQLTGVVQSSAARFSPLTTLGIVHPFLPSDLQFVSFLVGRHLLSSTLDMSWSTDGQGDLRDPLLPPQLAEACHLDGVWKGWLDGDFDAARLRAMKTALDARGWTTNDIESNLGYRTIPRDSEGWYLSTATALKLGSKKPVRPPQGFWSFMLPVEADSGAFASLRGLRVDTETGRFDLMIERAVETDNAFLCETDVSDILGGALIGVSFTLENPPGAYPCHPFQELRASPQIDALAGTGLLETLLATDYLLKMLSMGVEVCSKSPFRVRPAADGLLQRVPARLRRSLRSVPERRDESPDHRELPFGSMHRFWIEPESMDVPVKKFSNDATNLVTYEFSAPRMIVKCRKLKLNADGQIVDDTDAQTSDDSPEMTFARDFSRNYDELAVHFPELRRLKELTRVLLASQILYQDHYLQEVAKTSGEAVDSLKLSQSFDQLFDELRPALRQFRPFSENLVNECYAETLAQNNVSAWRVSSQEEQRVRREIRNGLLNSEAEALRQVTRTLARVGHLAATDQSLSNQVRAWLYAGCSAAWETRIRSTLRHGIQAFVKSEATSRVNAMISLGLRPLRASDLNNLEGIFGGTMEPPAGASAWVPAAFLNEGGGFRVYGGVNLRVRAAVRPHRTQLTFPSTCRPMRRATPRQAKATPTVRTRAEPQAPRMQESRLSISRGSGAPTSGQRSSNRGPTTTSSAQQTMRRSGVRGGSSGGGGSSRGGRSRGGGRGGGGGNGGKSSIPERHLKTSRETVDKAWKRLYREATFLEKCHVGGKPMSVQHTGPRKRSDGGHGAKVLEMAWQEVRNPAVERVFTNRSLRIAIQETFSIKLPRGVGRSRPDVLSFGRLPDGRVTIGVTEVPSLTDRNRKGRLTDLFKRAKATAMEAKNLLQEHGIEVVLMGAAKVVPQTRGSEGQWTLEGRSR